MNDANISTSREEEEEGQDIDYNVITSDSSPELAESLSQPMAAQRPDKTKFKTTSRAILFFKRAKSVLKSSTSTNSIANSDNNDANSLNNFKTYLQAFSFKRNHTNASSRDNESLELATSANHAPGSKPIDNCQFIVPKMNTLKMPLVCLIKSVDGEVMREIFIHRYELGSYLIENLKVSLNCLDLDTKYLGLRLAKSLDDQEDLKNPWLNLNEPVCKQLKQFSTKSSLATKPVDNNRSIKSVDLYLRIKFYPPNLARVQDSFLRQYLWIQLRRDLSLGKLTSSMNNLTLLMACILQYEFGDYDDNKLNQVEHLNIMPNQDLIEDKAIELWKNKLVNCRKHQAQMQFLRTAVILETYGFDYYPVRDHQRPRDYLLGFNYAGVKTIRNGRIVHHLSWHSLSKVCYERRMIIFHQHPTENSKVK